MYACRRRWPSSAKPINLPCGPTTNVSLWECKGHRNRWIIVVSGRLYERSVPVKAPATSSFGEMSTAAQMPRRDSYNNNYTVDWNDLQPIRLLFDPVQLEGTVCRLTWCTKTIRSVPNMKQCRKRKRSKLFVRFGNE